MGLWLSCIWKCHPGGDELTNSVQTSHNVIYEIFKISLATNDWFIIIFIWVTSQHYSIRQPAPGELLFSSRRTWIGVWRVHWSFYILINIYLFVAVWTGAFYIVTVRLFPEKYHQISWKLEGTRLCVSRYSIAVKFGMCLSSIAAEAPARFHSNMILLNAQHRGCHSSRYLLIKSHFGSWINGEWIPWIMVIQFHSIKQWYGSSNSCSCINWCNLHLNASNRQHPASCIFLNKNVLIVF